jgi:small subunit ribosomal protein S20
MQRKKSGLKEARKAIKRRERNKYYKTTMKTYIKKTLESSSKEEIDTNLRLAIKAIDKAAQKKVIHKNNAANKKSKLMRKINKLFASPNK